MFDTRPWTVGRLACSSACNQAALMGRKKNETLVSRVSHVMYAAEMWQDLAGCRAAWHSTMRWSEALESQDRRRGRDYVKDSIISSSVATPRGVPTQELAALTRGIFREQDTSGRKKLTCHHRESQLSGFYLRPRSKLEVLHPPDLQLTASIVYRCLVHSLHSSFRGRQRQ